LSRAANKNPALTARGSGLGTGLVPGPIGNALRALLRGNVLLRVAVLRLGQPLLPVWLTTGAARRHTRSPFGTQLHEPHGALQNEHRSQNESYTLSYQDNPST
jgi:hypothetical protein